MRHFKTFEIKPEIKNKLKDLKEKFSWTETVIIEKAIIELYDRLKNKAAY